MKIVCVYVSEREERQKDKDKSLLEKKRLKESLLKRERLTDRKQESESRERKMKLETNE